MILLCKLGWPGLYACLIAAAIDIAAEQCAADADVEAASAKKEAAHPLAALERAAAAGITRIITIGTDLESSQRAVALAEAHAPVYAVVGWHPNDLAEAPDDVRPELRELCAHPKVVAIGETGIDHFRLSSSNGGNEAEDAAWKERQVKIFRQQLELAAEMNLNAVIHQRAALEPTLEIFEEYADRVRGQFHCFVNDAAGMRRIIDLGSLVSFTGIITFKNAQGF